MESSSELRVFLSSTFIDFREERDFLAKKVFPALRRLCRERGIEFTEIDLRWGLTGEDAKNGRIIRTCLEEIDHCRPFFCGFLGARYGWVPGQEELDKDPDLKKEMPWLQDAVNRDQSVTEMEFRHGFLNQSPGKTRPLVYFRKPATDDPEDERLTRLKREVEGYVGKVPIYASPAELAAMLERDLTEVIEAHWPLSEKHSWIEDERMGHAAFAQSRRKAYVPNLELLAHLDAHMTRPEPVLLITGESGGGKSSLLSYWAESLRAQDSSVFLIEHYVGVTAASNDRDTIMRRVMEEIKERTKSDDVVPQSSEELERAFPQWLARMTNERLTIVIDAINQLSADSGTEGTMLSWLPEHMPGNIKWVISSTESEALRRVRQRNENLPAAERWPELVVEPITPEVRRQVLRTFLASYQKRLARSQENRIISDPKSSSPLFLRSLLEELRLQGVHEDLDKQIEYYLASHDIADLFTRVLERLELDYGKEDVMALLRAIWAAPYGLAESELIEASNLERSTLSLLLHAFDFHFVRIKGRLSFFHDHLRHAIERRYMGAQEEKQRAWSDLATYFQGTEASAIKAHSLPWLLNRAEQWETLRQSLLDIDLLPYLTEGSRTYDLLSYWLSIEKVEEVKVGEHDGAAHWTVDVVGEYEAALERYATERKTKIQCQTEGRLLYSLALFFHNAGWLAGTVRTAARALALCDNLVQPDATQADALASLQGNGQPCLEPCADPCGEPPDPGAHDLAIDIRIELGVAHIDSGDLKQASEVLERAMQMVGADRSQDGTQAHASLREIQVRTRYALLLAQLGKYAESEAAARTAMNAATERFGAAHHTTLKAMRYLAEALAMQGKAAESEAIYRSVLKKVESSMGADSLETAESLNDLGNLLRLFHGDYQEAQHLLERAGEIIESRLGSNHPDLGVLLNNLASLHLEHREFALAEPIFMRCLEIGEKAHGAEHPSNATIVNNYASMLYGQQEFDRAEPHFRRALAIRRKVYGDEHPETVISLNNMANVLRRAGRNLDEAEDFYKEVLRLRLESLGPDHLYTGFTFAAYGQLLRLKNDPARAADHLDRAFAIYKRERGAQHRDTIPVALELAEALLELAEFDKAQAVIEEALVGADISSLSDNIRERVEKLLSDRALVPQTV